MKFKLLLQGLHLLETFHQFEEIFFFCKQFSNTQIEIYIMHLFFSQIFIHCFLYCEYLWIINHTDIVKIIKNLIGIILKHKLPHMIIVNHNRDHNINLHHIKKFNSIIMIEHHEIFFQKCAC